MLSFSFVTPAWATLSRRVLLLGAILALEAGPARAVEPSTRCDGSQAARLLGWAAREWQSACWRTPDGRQVIAAVPLPALVPAAVAIKPPVVKRTDAGRPTPDEGAPAGPLVVRLGLVRDGAVLWRGEIRPDGKTAEVREVLKKSEEWLVGVEDQPLGEARGVRVGVVGHWGHDLMSVREIAFLFRLPAEAGAMQLLWSGIGNTRESRFDYCRIEGIASFQLVDPRTLERSVHVSHNINRETQLPRPQARALEKKCSPTPQPSQRFPIASE